MSADRAFFGILQMGKRRLASYIQMNEEVDQIR
jgi:hypothetical protein